tara:strand:+ start:11579 stop:13333 length:1755 start_codon:yes stop_codon:yes gene_type:complete
MCGFLGIFSSKISIDKEKKLKKAIQLLSHRGPDEEGSFKNENTILLHKRLSIIDLKGGKQPIENNDCVLVSNGEIYNDVLLRKQILDYRYKTGSDCESILAVYIKYGINGFKKLRGMYAFAIYDKKKKKMILGRDPFGIKPLYFNLKNKECLFSSEIQPILKSRNHQIKLKRKKIIELLQIQYNSGRNTIFKGILRVRPGETIILDSKINIEKSVIFEKSKNFWIDVPHKTKHLEKVLLDSVRVHQRSDVPFGLFFSGGIDSTIILYLMSKISKKKIISYSIIFEENNEPNEIIKLKEIATRCNSEIHFINFSENDFWNILPQALKANDDPILDYAIVPTFKLAQVAKKDVKVILSGEGGDEIFAGYGRHRKIMRPFLNKSSFINSEMDKVDFLKKKFKGWDFDLNFYKTFNMNLDMTPLQRLQLFDCEEWLPNNLLIKLDRCLMANNLEGRTPFIDLDVFKNFFGINDKLKVKKGLGKFLLRSFLQTNMSSYNFLEKKRGFTVPINNWIPRKSDELSDLLPKNKLLQKILKTSEIRTMCIRSKRDKKFIVPVWRLLCLSIWYQVHFDNAIPSNNTFNILSMQN